MKSILFAVAALFFYAVQNVIIEKKLAQISPIANIVFFDLGMLTIAVTILVFRNQFGFNFTMPQGNQYWFLALCGVLLFVADFCFFSAYNSSGSLITITTIVVLLPVFASLIKFSIGGGFPSAAQLLGWVLAAASVLLVSKQ